MIDDKMMGWLEAAAVRAGESLDEEMLRLMDSGAEAGKVLKNILESMYQVHEYSAPKIPKYSSENL